jgi:hypothetical protein
MAVPATTSIAKMVIPSTAAADTAVINQAYMEFIIVTSLSIFVYEEKEKSNCCM